MRIVLRYDHINQHFTLPRTNVRLVHVRVNINLDKCVNNDNIRTDDVDSLRYFIKGYIMGMYTEIFINVDLKKETPNHVIDTCKAICESDYQSEHLKNKPDRWSCLFGNGSYYTPSTSCAKLTFDDISGQYSLIGKGDIKNYEHEIQEFFEFIKPWSDSEFMGYMRYEEDREPILIYSN